jgi:hypothetical protein
MDNSSIDRSFLYCENPKKIGLNSLTRSKVIAFLIFTKFTCDLMQVHCLVYYIR